MRYEGVFFEEMHPQIAHVIGIAVMQPLVEKQEPSRGALIEMIQVLCELAVELAIDVLLSMGNKKPAIVVGPVICA